MSSGMSAHDPADLIDALLRSVHHPCYLVGHGRRPLAVSDAFCELSGYGAEEFLNLPMSTPITPPGDHASTSRALDDALAGKPPVRLQRELILRDGSLIPVESTGRRLSIRGASPIVLVEFWSRQGVAFNTHPTEGSSAPPSVAAFGREFAPADLLAALLASLSHACFAVSQARNLVLITDALCELTGYGREAIEGFGSAELPFAEPDGRPEIQRALQAALAGSPPHRRSRELVRASGELIAIESSATLMPVDGGSPLILVEFWPVAQAGEATDAA